MSGGSYLYAWDDVNKKWVKVQVTVEGKIILVKE